MKRKGRCANIWSVLTAIMNFSFFLQMKCHKYWPDEIGKSLHQDSFRIEVQESLVLASYTVRTFSLQRKGCKTERIIRQFHFTVWPDHGVPEYPSQLLYFVRQVMQDNPLKNGPMVVHCSAGVGRTGTFITLFTQLQRIQAEGNVDIFGFVRSMRHNRCLMVQTKVIISHNCVELSGLICSNRISIFLFMMLCWKP